MNKLIRMNPTHVVAVGKYSHVTIIPKDAQLYTFSGQIGADNHGNIPSEYTKQIENTFKNIYSLLDTQFLHPDDIIKVNIWATEDIDWDNVFYPIWEQFFGESFPSMTIAYISALGLPEIKIEIEVWAAKVF